MNKQEAFDFGCRLYQLSNSNLIRWADPDNKEYLEHAFYNSMMKWQDTKDFIVQEKEYIIQFWSSSSEEIKSTLLYNCAMCAHFDEDCSVCPLNCLTETRHLNILLDYIAKAEDYETLLEGVLAQLKYLDHVKSNGVERDPEFKYDYVEHFASWLDSKKEV